MDSDHPRVYLHWTNGLDYDTALRWVEALGELELAESVEEADVVVVLRGAEDGEFGEKLVVRQGEWSVGHTLRVARAKVEASASARDGLRLKS